MKDGTLEPLDKLVTDDEVAVAISFLHDSYSTDYDRDVARLIERLVHQRKTSMTDTKIDEALKQIQTLVDERLTRLQADHGSAKSLLRECLIELAIARDMIDPDDAERDESVRADRDDLMDLIKRIHEATK